MRRHYDANSAIYAFDDAVIALEGVNLYSHVTALHAVDRAALSVISCSLSAEVRSVCVLLGDACAAFWDTKITKSSQQGCCLRGKCELMMTDCVVSGCVRGVYGYQLVKIQLKRCVFTKNKAGVEVHGFISAEDVRLSLEVRGCSIAGNTGVGLKVIGAVALIVDDATINEDGESIKDVSEEPMSCQELAPDDGPASWEYHVDDPTPGRGLSSIPGWRKYSESDSAQIEFESVAGGGTPVFLSGGKYSINIRTLEQTNVCTLHSRAIRRMMRVL
jgi:hypothetical protein